MAAEYVAPTHDVSPLRRLSHPELSAFSARSRASHRGHNAALVDLYGRDDATKPQAAACARALASELDVTRAKFWTHKAEALTA